MTKFRDVFGHTVHEGCLDEMLIMLNKYGYNRLLAVMAYCAAIFIPESETKEERMMWHQFMGTLAIMIDRVPMKFVGGTIDEPQYTSNWPNDSGKTMVDESQCDGSGI